MDDKMTAVLYSSEQPSEKDMERLSAFLGDKYQKNVSIGWKKSEKIKGGFRLVAGNDVYDWSAEGKLRRPSETS